MLTDKQLLKRVQSLEEFFDLSYITEDGWNEHRPIANTYNGKYNGILQPLFEAKEAKRNK